MNVFLTTSREGGDSRQRCSISCGMHCVKMLRHLPVPDSRFPCQRDHGKGAARGGEGQRSW